MKRNNALILMVLAGMLVASGTAFAADATTAVDINSAYVWRGMTFNDGLVVQPSVNVVSGGFGLNVWGNLDVDDYDDTLKSGEFSEVDLTLSYTHQAGPVAITAGYIEYMFPTIKTTTIKESEEVTREAFEGGALGTREVYLDAIVKPVDGVSVGLASYYDFDGLLSESVSGLWYGAHAETLHEPARRGRIRGQGFRWQQGSGIF